MARLRKRGDYYHALMRVGDMPHTISKSLKTGDKQVANKLMWDEIALMQQERAGLAPFRALRDAAKKSLSQHLKDYAAHLRSLRRSEIHIRRVCQRLAILAHECGWGFASVITAQSFEAWRNTNGDKAAKTLNHYLDSVRFLLNWMVEDGRLKENPLRRLKKIPLSGNEKRVRRALTPDEVRRLLATAGDMMPVFAMAVYTGLRRAELEGLQWGDLELDEAPYFVRARASTTKNRKVALLPLRGSLADVLRAIRPPNVSTAAPVFGGLRRMRDMLPYWKRAGVVFCDEQGRIADFHSFRVTYCTEQIKSGVPLRVVQENMRHSTAELTAGVYTDVRQLSLAAAIEGMPDFLSGLPLGLAQHLRQTPVPTVPDASPSVMEHSLQTIAPDTLGQQVAQLVTNENGGGGGSRTPVLKRNRGSYYMLSPDLYFRPGGRRWTGLPPSLSSCWFLPLGPDARLCGQPDVVVSGPLSGVRAETHGLIRPRVRTVRSQLLF